MSAERNCVIPFIEQTQRAFLERNTFNEAVQSISSYQARVKNLVTDISPEARIPHAVAMSSIFLTAVIGYEYARSQGVPLPDLKEIIGSAVPVASFSNSGERKLSRRELRNITKNAANIATDGDERRKEELGRKLGRIVFRETDPDESKRLK
ncbi:MAG: hypothetical protein US60_C0018G0012 [Microgenomates group bacterium GW2011_GWC1_37_8]|uniref:Uncharacterized protein n=1 Tax=Candidatus Woesebacteria bacterium RIFCSPHIGHO2_01_FULL_38_9b TaxID=1802493 RepID=A0A1F7Y3Q1_9BACT|nr:MAG: hypothetical protein US60_C0018G0012 [Microgenomates group bacterium GW2011_GWC1_37_8]OGM21921.1 MAG: hypothetical protein A2863_03385 [Candidatus Woesebacteria bacterium RIFCSPHIGHO2_01_FULL_38_9b]